jgi:hypothetical protein
MLGTVHHVKLEDRPVPAVLVPTTTKAIKEILEPCWFLKNDFAVNWISALAQKDPCQLEPNVNPVASSLPLSDAGSIPANHATMSTATTGSVVLNWIRQAQPLQ